MQAVKTASRETEQVKLRREHKCNGKLNISLYLKKIIHMLQVHPRWGEVHMKSESIQANTSIASKNERSNRNKILCERRKIE